MKKNIKLQSVLLVNRQRVRYQFGQWAMGQWAMGHHRSGRWGIGQWAMGQSIPIAWILIQINLPDWI